MHASPRPTEATPRHPLRGDVQGLRALAVLLVVADHLLGRPSGGYVGVDVFFVISGFLITGQLLREHAATGRISLRRFYERRVKRLGPAAIAVVATTLVAAAIVYTPERLGRIAVDAVWAVLFGANWRMIATGTDYMHGGTTVSPLQHFWSLSVEEQFYFVWPLLLLAVLAGAAVARRLRPTLLIGVLLAASLAWGALESRAEPTWAYFSTFSRGWELALGALLACLAAHASRLPNAVRPVLLWAGLTGILGSAVVLDGHSLFPVPGAVPAVLGAAAIIASGIGRPSRGAIVLANRPAVYVGTLSYSIYLWHFPVITLVQQLTSDRGAWYLALCAVLIGALALLSYHWIEEPLRHRSWRLRPSAPTVRKPVSVRRSLVPVGLLTLVAVTATTAATVHTEVVPARAAVSVGDLVDPAPAPAAQARAAAITAALRARQSPQVAQPAFARQWAVDGCLGGWGRSLPDPAANAERCVYGDPHASRSLVVYGDSVALSFVPGLVRAAPDWRIEVWTLQQCPAVPLQTLRSDGSLDPSCARFRPAALAHLRRTHPDVVLASSSPAAASALADGTHGPAAIAKWRAATRRLVDEVAPLTDSLVLLDAPPPGKDYGACGGRFRSPAACVSTVQQAFVDVARAQRAGVADAHRGNVRYPADLGWFCSPTGVCPAVVGRSVMLADTVHLSDADSRALAPVLAEALDLR